MTETKTLVQNIRNHYAQTEKTDDKLETLIALDKKVKTPARVFSYIFGTVGSLVLGTGMSIALGAIGGASLFPVGVAIGCVGLVVTGVCYPLYRAILKSRKKKYGEKVLSLTDELLAR